MIKTCEICAAEYDASRANQRYCQECGKNPELARRKLIAAEIRNKEHAGDKYRSMFTTDRAKNRAKTFLGIARAMAEQWGETNNKKTEG